MQVCKQMTDKWKRKGNTRRRHTHGKQKEKKGEDDTHMEKKKKIRQKMTHT